MLQLITGGSGCGKTYYVRQRLCELAGQGKTPILIVPEQYSFESERTMLAMLGAKDAHNVRVYSFTRLAEDVARKIGGSAGRRLDDCGRVAAMGLVLSKLSHMLSYYKGKRSSHFIEHLLDAVKEFRLCALQPADIARVADLTDGRLREKLSELALIYGAYEAVTAQAAPSAGEKLYDTLRENGVYDGLPEQPALDPMTDLDRLYEQLESVRFFEGAHVFVDSFRGYTGQEFRILERIMKQSELCAVTVCLEHAAGSAEAESGLFATAHSTVGQLRKIAEKCGCDMLPEITLSKRYRYRSEALGILESSLYRRDEDRLVYEGPTDDLTLYEASDRYDELEFCARECRRLVREEGYRCRDIAIIARSEKTYAPIAADALALQSLPCFADLRVDASGSPLMRFVMAALEAARGNLRPADMLRCLKTGMINGITPSDISEMENYCYIWDLPSDGWLHPFEQHPDGMKASFTESSTERLGRINEVRERMCALLLPLREALRSGCAEKMTAAVYELAEGSGAARCLEVLSEGLTPTEAAELPQLWELLISVLEQLHAILEGTKCSAEDFIAYMSLMIKRADVGHIPHGLDEITFGGADRLRVSSPRAVFVVGALDGEFPAIPGSAGVFTDDERRRLRDELGVQVAQTADSKLLEERLLVYNAFSAASERLYITWPAVAGGEEAVMSEGVQEALRCVPNAARLHYGSAPVPEHAGSAEAVFELYARCLSEDSEQTASLRAALEERENWRGRVRSVEEAHRCDAPSAPGREGAEAMFGDRIMLSASRAEKYHQCGYSFFCRYGLGIEPLRKAQLDHMEYGTVAHYVLENIFGGSGSIDAVAKDADTAAERVKELLEQYLREELGGERGKSEEFLYRLRIMHRSLTALVLNLAAELAAGSFEPVSYELKLGEGCPVEPEAVIAPGGLTGHLSGSIDRVDRFVKDGKTYLRVVDYKTGKKVFSLSSVLEGLNMQMIIYLSELCAAQEGSQPAGLLYCPSFSGYAEGDRTCDGAALVKKRDESLRRSGLVVEPEEHLPEGRPVEEDDLPVSRGMENTLGGNFVPVKLAKDKESGIDGAMRLNNHSVNKVISDREFEVIGRYVRKRLTEMVENIGAGELVPDPVQNGKDSPCSWCDYYPVCRHTGQIRKVNRIDTHDAVEIMKTELGEGGDGQ